MKRLTVISKLKRFELHHKILLFTITLALTILIIRLMVSIHNPNPSIFNFELHHFDYGLLLLMITTLLLLFGNKNSSTYLLLAAVSFGIVLDDLWFIRRNILDPNGNELLVYNATFPVVVISVILSILVILLITHFRKKESTK